MVANFIVVGKDDGRIGVLVVGLDYFLRIIIVINVVLVSDGDKWGGGRMDSEIKVAANICMFASGGLEMILGGESFDVLVGCGSSN